MGQMIQMLQAQLKDATDKVQLKAIELQSKEKIEAAKLETDILIEKYKNRIQTSSFHFMNRCNWNV